VVPGDAHLDDPAFVRALGSYARAGGTVVLTDGALRLLSGLGVLPSGAIGSGTVYAGYVEVTAPNDPLARGLRGPSPQKQTYEPVPLGYLISNTFSSSSSVTTAPAWWVNQGAWEAMGGRTVGTTGSGRTSLGEIALGKGHIRILGSLLPPPVGDWAHPFGAADYGVTYVGYTLLENLLGATASLEAVASAGGSSPPESSPTRKAVVKAEHLAATGIATPTGLAEAFLALAALALGLAVFPRITARRRFL